MALIAGKDPFDPAKGGKSVFKLREARVTYLRAQQNQGFRSFI
jgi:hypothetical protein